MNKVINFRDYSIAIKIGLWGAALLAMLFIIVMVNNKQFRTMGAEFVVLKDEVVPAMSVIEKLDVLIYQQTINLDKIIHIRLASIDEPSTTSDELRVALNRYDELAKQLAAEHQVAVDLMSNFARLEMRATKARWIRLQDQRQKQLQTSLDVIGSKIKQQTDLANERFKSIGTNSTAEVTSLQMLFDTLDQVLHRELTNLREATNNAISTSEQKLHHMEYGSRQLSMFLLFWFNLIGAILGYFIIRSIVRRIKSATTFAQKIAEGDLSGQLEVKNQDELGQLSQAMNGIVSSTANK